MKILQKPIYEQENCVDVSVGAFQWKHQKLPKENIEIWTAGKASIEAAYSRLLRQFDAQLLNTDNYSSRFSLILNFCCE